MVLQRQNGGFTWDVIPRRRFTDEEIRQAAVLCEILDIVVLNNDEDSKIWEEGRHSFSANRVLKLLAEQRRRSGQTCIENFPSERIWKTGQVPPKVGFFLWTIIRGRVLTTENLKKRGWHIVSRCSFCLAAEESVEHLFVSFHVIQSLWRYFSDSFGVDFQSVPHLKGRLAIKPRLNLSRVGRMYWDTCIHAISWGVWLERNRRIFYGKLRSLNQMIGDIKQLIWDWNILSLEGRNITIEQVMFDWERVLF